MDASLIRVHNLRRYYQMGEETVRALDGVDIEIGIGEFVAIVGPSGSGKSTLMYLIGGMDRPTDGQVIVNGEEITAMDDNDLAKFRQRTVGFVFQSFNLITTMSARGNVEFPMIFAGHSPNERRGRAAELLSMVGLGDRLDHKPTELSGGQQQRVAIARALVNRPKIILADEPTGNLDSKSGMEVINILKQLNEEGVTIVMVTHDQSLLSLTSRFIRIKDGQILREE
ncbi:MAG: ABC transporter ATP-binding protein [Chloroflexota bacterium]